jgi:hypothetical protein
MVQPRKVNIDELCKELSCTTPILADHCVTAIKLADNAVTGIAINSATIDASKFTLSVFGNGLVYNSFTDSIDINVDDLTLEVNLDILRVKTGGIHPSHIDIDADLAFNNFQGLAFRLENLISDPIPGNPGRVIWRSDLSEARIDTGIVFIPLGSVASYQKDLVTVSNIVTDHVITLSHTPITNSEIIIWNGLVLRPGAFNDYILSTNIVTLNIGIILTIGDELEVVYAY